ncbi:MAG: ATP-binding protein [Bryobacteraceae bacterium]
MSRITTSPDELSTLKEEFLASLNHEIRTPLSGVLGMVDLLLETELTGEQKEYLDDARMCAENLLEILNSTLEFSALSADQVALEEAEFSLRSMLDGMLDDFAFKAKAKGLRLIRNFSPDAPEVACGDALRLQQIVSQLVMNAIKFTNQGEVEVSVGVSRIEDSAFVLNVKVRDTGIGISEDKLDRIFDSFRQLETGLARRYTGMGLGLAVTQKLVQLMRGEIGVNSKPGHGSEFSVHIPLGTVHEQINPQVETGAIREFRFLARENRPVAETLLPM